MNVLFITLYGMQSVYNHGIYEDLLRQFIKNEHQLTVITTIERRVGKETVVIEEEKCKILQVKTGNITKTNLIEKGISTILLERQLVNRVKEYFGNIRFDMVLYSTPPITLAGVVEYVKKRDGAKTYLLLKDIFPQNAIDIGMMSKFGVKGVLYQYFRNREKRLYALSDFIGCMSPANVEYVIRNNPEIDEKRVVMCPNCIEPRDMSVGRAERIAIRQKYHIPIDKKVLVYGGNLGKPQGIPFFIECLKSQKANKDFFFLIVGSGTEYGKLRAYIKTETPDHVRLLNHLPKEDYECMIGGCDIGMIFLDQRFTIPNFPSRLLSYMQAKLPVLAVTDPNTDIGKVIVDGGFGWWCESNDVKKFDEVMDRISQSTELMSLAKNGWNYLIHHYSAEKVYEQLSTCFK